MKNKTIYYWSPFLTEIATVKAVINSAYSLRKISEDFEVTILDAAGEFKKKTSEILQKKINLLKLSNIDYIKFLPKHGKILSRLSFFLIFICSFFPLKKVIKNKEPDFIIIHLITSLPLIIFYFFNLKTKCILRISGYPKMNLLRLFFWRIVLKKVYLITCPTKGTYNYLKELDIVNENKLKVLYDPIINVNEILKEKNKQSLKFEKNYAIAIGRFTEQKNFEFLINAFKSVVKEIPNLDLIIVGKGEQKKLLIKTIRKNQLENKVKILKYQKNIFPILKNAKCFILPSLWEDPGFVLLEAAFMRCLIISSDCQNGPKEIVEDKNAGLMFNSNNLNDFLEKIKEFKNLDNSDIKKYKLNALKACRPFTIFTHGKNLKNILQ